MESFVLDVKGRENGIILQNKTFLPSNGPIFSVKNSFHQKSVNFIHAAWNKSDSKIVAGDSLGNIYMFHLHKNRFNLIFHLKICSSFLTFTNDKTQDILVALSDCTIVSLHSDAKVIKNQFSHHSSSVFHISFSQSGQTVLSCSKGQALLWDLKTFLMMKLLNLKIDVDIIKVCFLFRSDVILSAFNDNTVFLWDFKNFVLINSFICSCGDDYLNLRTVDISRDEKLIVCAGRANWLLVWDAVKWEKLNTIELVENVVSVKQINFLYNTTNPVDAYIICLLSSEGDVFIYDIKAISLIYKISSKYGRIISMSCSFNFFQILAVSLQGSLDLYDVEDFVMIRYVEKLPKVKAKSSPVHKTVKAFKKKEKKEKNEDIERKKLQTVLKQFEEYPEKHRNFIWSQLLKLPRNEEAFKMMHQESLSIQKFVKNYSFMNPGVQKTFLRLMSMLALWYPVVQEIDFIQCVVFPFVKILHKNTIMCFEVLVTFISNWCQNWFLFCPFPPFNILCAVENIILFHDRELMSHFMKHKISAEVYAWTLLKTSFSEVFNKKEWLKLWDNIFSNSLSFYLFAVAAFNIAIRPLLLKCVTLEQFKHCYRKHSITSSMLLKKTYTLQASSPQNINPEAVMGQFSPIPEDVYPTFFQMARMKIDLQTLTRKKIIDLEINYLQQREESLEIKSNYLQELQKLQLLRRDLLLDSIELKDIDALHHLNEKLIRVQNLIQDNLTDQIGMLKGAIGEEILYDDIRDSKKQYFDFQDYMKKLRRKDK